MCHQEPLRSKQHFAEVKAALRVPFVLSDDELLVRWRKLPQAAVPLPPPGLNLTGWRDPFVYLGASSDQPGCASWGKAGLAAEDGAAGTAADAAGAAAGVSPGSASSPAQQEQQEQQQGRPGYRMLLGSGVKGAGGALLGYSSSHPGVGSSNDGSGSGSGGSSSGNESSSLATGWRYTGPVCSVADLKRAAAAAGEDLDAESSVPDGASSGGSPRDGTAGSAAVLSPAAAAHELGEVWECPLLAQLPPPSHSRSSAAGQGVEQAIDGGSSSPGQAPWLLAVSPYPCKPPNVKSNPVLYWIGCMNGEEATRQVATVLLCWS